LLVIVTDVEILLVVIGMLVWGMMEKMGLGWRRRLVYLNETRMISVCGSHPH